MTPEDLAVETRIVRVPPRTGREPLLVELTWVCPRCGGPRGYLFPGVFFDGTDRIEVDAWNNPCGHVDQYNDVRCEAEVAAGFRQVGPLETRLDALRDAAISDDVRAYRHALAAAHRDEATPEQIEDAYRLGARARLGGAPRLDYGPYGGMI